MSSFKSEPATPKSDSWLKTIEYPNPCRDQDK